MIDMQSARIAFADAKSRNELSKALGQALQPSRVNAFALGFLPEPAATGDAAAPLQDAAAAPNPFLLLDWPREWLELYARCGFAADDIVVAEAARTTEPFTWREVQARNPGRSAHIFAAASDFGWTDGFVVPVHDPLAAPGERLGVISLAASTLNGLDQAARQTLAALSLAAFARALALRRAASALPYVVKLTPREREALALVAGGLNDIDIGARLSIATATAHYHIERAKRRLGAVTRAQAVAIAIVQDLL